MAVHAMSFGFVRRAFTLQVWIFATANIALTAIVIASSICSFGVELMAVNALSFLCVLCWCAHTPKRVHATRYSFEVIRIDTSSISTEMI